MEKQPIKRHTAIQPLSREHHHGLLLCWKIRQGLQKNIEPSRIKTYVDWFWDTNLASHFQKEECYLFPILGTEHPLIKQALEEHKTIKTLIENQENIGTDSLFILEKILNDHIRFEERILFNEIQNSCSIQQLENIEMQLKDEKFEDNLRDPFWEK